MSDHVISQLCHFSKFYFACIEDHVTRHMHVELHDLLKFNFTLTTTLLGGVPSTTPTSPSLARNARQRGRLPSNNPEASIRACFRVLLALPLPLPPQNPEIMLDFGVLAVATMPQPQNEQQMLVFGL